MFERYYLDKQAKQRLAEDLTGGVDCQFYMPLVELVGTPPTIQN